MYKKAKNTWLKHLDFTIIDLLLLVFSYMIISNMRFGFHIPDFRKNLIFTACLILVLIYFCIALFTSAYKNILRRTRWTELRATIIQIIATFTVFAVYLYFTQRAMFFSRSIYFGTALCSLIFIYAGRIIWKRIIRLHMLNNSNLPHLLVIADECTARKYIRAIKKRRYNDFYMAGAIVVDKDMKGLEIEGIPVVSDSERMRQYILSEVVDQVFVNINDPKTESAFVDYCLEAGITVHISLLGNIKELPNQQIEKMGGHMVLTTSNKIASGWKLMVKRLIDILGGIVGLIITGILCLFLAPKIKKIDPGPIFFSQMRVGKNGRPFKIYKFRSMYLDAEERKKELMSQNEMDGLMFKMENDPRILPGIGHKIRDWSLDEFPQFLNVLKGEMSLVGTRPPTVDEFKQYDAHHKMRLSFKPGITGMWQVSGRSKIKDFEKIVELDNKYITQWTILLDFKIIFKTLRVVFHKDGAM